MIYDVLNACPLYTGLFFSVLFYVSLCLLYSVTIYLMSVLEAIQILYSYSCWFNLQIKISVSAHVALWYIL